MKKKSPAKLLGFSYSISKVVEKLWSLMSVAFIVGLVSYLLGIGFSFAGVILFITIPSVVLAFVALLSLVFLETVGRDASERGIKLWLLQEAEQGRLKRLGIGKKKKMPEELLEIVDVSQRQQKNK